jgi:hypothetical protein
MDDLSLPEVRRLVDAPEKNGGFLLKMETKAVPAGRRRRVGAVDGS